MRIVKSINFDAAHYLGQGDGSRPYSRLHGHSFLLEVEIEGEPDPAAGWVVDFGELADALERLRDQLDHHLLNEIDGLERPTLENICLWAAEKLQPEFRGLRSVTIARPSIGEKCIHVVAP